MAVKKIGNPTKINEIRLIIPENVYVNNDVINVTIKTVVSNVRFPKIKVLFDTCFEKVLKSKIDLNICKYDKLLLFVFIILF